MRLAPLLLVLGCQTTRMDALQAETLALSNEVAQTRDLVAAMEAQLEKHRQAHARKAEDRSPPDHDPARPLPRPHPSRPDVILVSIDTLRADHLGAWGYERDTSPFIDELAAGGTRFDSTWAPSPWTLPSHATMLSGLLPPSHGAVEDRVRIASDVPMLQEAFGEAGYGTIGVVATLFVSERFGFDRGFDHFQDFQIRGAAMNNAATVDAGDVFAWGLHHAQQRDPGEPLFLFLHVYDAHYAYSAPEPFDSHFDRPSQVGDALYKEYGYYKRNPLPADQMAHQVAQYDEEIRYVDDALRSFVERWRSERPALVIVTADHGEEFGERGSWGHAHTLYPEQLHVPWIVNGPGVRAQVVSQRVGSEDIAPTLAGLARVPHPAGDGSDRSAQVRSGGRSGGEAARFADTSRFRTLRYRWHDQGWDLHIDLGQARRQLCHLVEDPACRDLAVAKDPERAEAMFQEMMGWLGYPWEALADGTVEAVDGVIYASDGSRQKRRYQVSGGTRFAVHPPDARIRFAAPDGGTSGPWGALAADLPDADAPIAFHGRRRATDTAIELSDEEREMLEALGYVQDH